MLFMSSPNDPFYLLDSFQRSAQLVRAFQLCLVPGMPHGMQAAWSRPEVGVFIDSWVKRGFPCRS